MEGIQPPRCLSFDRDVFSLFYLRRYFLLRYEYLKDSVLKFGLYFSLLDLLAYIEASRAASERPLSSDVGTVLFLLFMLLVCLGTYRKISVLITWGIVICLTALIGFGTLSKKSSNKFSPKILGIIIIHSSFLYLITISDECFP